MSSTRTSCRTRTSALDRQSRAFRRMSGSPSFPSHAPPPPPPSLTISCVHSSDTAGASPRASCATRDSAGVTELSTSSRVSRPALTQPSDLVARRPARMAGNGPDVSWSAWGPTRSDRRDKSWRRRTSRPAVRIVVDGSSMSSGRCRDGTGERGGDRGGCALGGDAHSRQGHALGPASILRVVVVVVEARRSASARASSSGGISYPASEPRGLPRLARDPPRPGPTSSPPRRSSRRASASRGGMTLSTSTNGRSAPSPAGSPPRGASRGVGAADANPRHGAARGLSLAAGRRVGSFEGGGCVGADVDGVGDGSRGTRPRGSRARAGENFSRRSDTPRTCFPRGALRARTRRGRTPWLRCRGTAEDLRRFGMGLDALRAPPRAWGVARGTPSGGGSGVRSAGAGRRSV